MSRLLPLADRRELTADGLFAGRLPSLEEGTEEAAARVGGRGLDAAAEARGDLAQLGGDLRLRLGDDERLAEVDRVDGRLVVALHVARDALAEEALDLPEVEV